MRHAKARASAYLFRAGRSAAWLAALCLAAGSARAQVNRYHVTRVDPGHGMTFAVNRGTGADAAPAWTYDVGFRAGDTAGKDPGNWIKLVFDGIGDFGGVRVAAGDYLKVYGIREVSLLVPGGFAAAFTPAGPGYELHNYPGFERTYGPEDWTASADPKRGAGSLAWNDAASRGFAPRGAWLAFQASAAAAGVDWRGTPHPQWGRFTFDPVDPITEGPVYFGMHVLADIVTKDGTASGRTGFVRFDEAAGGAAYFAPEASSLILLLGGLLPLSLLGAASRIRRRKPSA